MAGVQVDQTVRTQEVVATFDVYGEAERAVDLLADRDFPVERTAIIGRGLHMVEKVTARLTWASAAGRGALAGAVPGALVGWIFGLFNWVNPLAAAVLLALYGAIFGAVIGALTGVLIYALSRGRRDFVSVTALGADHYDLVVDADVTEQAVRLLEEAGLRRASPAPDGQA
ncbi:general stress protein [Frankia sp. QA3]|uniref:general stress protein n=1 Tax=Frankia sp. QA3 TaxID=710111 RepID=UPI001E511DAA|nr:general stress protein [Frankia sp. QA3]